MKPGSEILQTIKVGGNFTQGNISGQSAIGNNIIQMKDCVIIYPDGSRLNGLSWFYTQGVRPEINPNKVFGREKDIEEIDTILKNKSALAITGFCGTGKSTIASMYIERIQERGEFAGIYWRKMNETTDINEIIGSFFTVIGKSIEGFDEHYKIADKLNLFFQELNEAPYFLVFDNFEVLLNPENNKPVEAGFSDLIEMVNENSIKSKILFTSWESISSERGIRPLYYLIRGLDTSAGVLLLKREGVNDSEECLKRAVDKSGGHPLALLLLAQLVRSGEDTLSTLLNDDSIWIDEEGEVAEHILNRVYNERLSEEECKLLQYISIFRQPVPAKAILKIANDPKWTESKVNKIALSLIRKSLLQKTGSNYWEESLISKYAGDRLSDKIESNKLAYEYYVSIPLPSNVTKKEDVQTLIEAQHHACMAKEYDLAAHVIFDLKLHNYLEECENDLQLYNHLEKWGNYRALIEIYEKILPKNHFGTETLLTDKALHGWVIGNLGLAYEEIGEIEKAIKYLEQSLSIARKYGHIDGIVKRLNQLGLSYCNIGNAKKALEHHEKALIFSRVVRDRESEGRNLGNIGMAYLQLGDTLKALEYLEQALNISEELGYRKGEETYLGNLGSVYLRLGNCIKAIEFHEKALTISREIRDRKGESADLGNIGAAYLQLGDTLKALEYLEQALAIAKEIGNVFAERFYLGNIGTAYEHLGYIEKGIEYSEQALVITKKIGDKRGEGHNLINIGSSYLRLGNAKKAIECFEQVSVIAKKSEDVLMEQQNLCNIARAYLHLCETIKAFEHYNQALTIVRKLGNKHEEGKILRDIGFAYISTGKVKKGIYYTERSLLIAREIGNKSDEGQALAQLAAMHSYYGNFEIVIEYSKKALNISKEAGNKQEEARNLLTLGLTYSDIGNLKKAIEYIEKAIEITKETGDPVLINICEEALLSINKP